MKPSTHDLASARSDMAGGYTTEVASGEVGNSRDLDDPPPYGNPGPLPVSGTLVIEDGGLASGITLQNAAFVDIASGGTLSDFTAPTTFNGDGLNVYDGVQVNVLAGGVATGGTLDGSYLTVAGTATDLTTFGEQITVSVTVSGLTAASNAFPDHGGFSNVTTVQDGGSLRNSTLSGPGELLTQLGSTASDITLQGELNSYLVPFYPGRAAGEALVEQAAST